MHVDTRVSVGVIISSYGCRPLDAQLRYQGNAQIHKMNEKIPEAED